MTVCFFTHILRFHSVHASCTTNCLCNLIKERFTLEFLYSKAVAKVITFYTYFLILLKLFLRFFSRKVFVGRLLTASCKENHLNLIILPRFLFQYVISYACFPVEAGAKVLSLYVPSKSFYLFFCGFHSNVTTLLHKLLILFYLRDKTFFRFSLFIFSDIA